jgi:superfamily II DNA or RNA helicase
MDLGFNNEYNNEVDYSENNDSDSQQDEQNEIKLKQENQKLNNLGNSALTAETMSESKNSIYLDGINNKDSIYNNSRNSEIINNNNSITYSSNNEQVKKLEPIINKKNEKFDLEEKIKNENMNNNINNEINENILYKNILNMIIVQKNNKINNSIIISENNSFSNYITNSLIQFNISMNKKICYLTPDTKRAQNIYDTYKNNKNIKSILLQKGKNKKNKNDLQSFLEQLNQNNLFIVLPNILYKLLSIGFTKFSDFGLIIFDECHLCDSNNPYNIIMQEFYFYYFKFPSHTINANTLPNILGITKSPFKDKGTIKNEKKYVEILKNLSENLDCQMIVDPNIFEDHKKLGEENIDIIGVKSIFEQKNKIDGINILLMKYFFEPMLDFCLDDYVKNNGNKQELNQYNKKEVKNKYLSVLKEKFSKELIEEYNNIETSERTIHFLSQNSIMFKIFEDIQKMLIIIIQNEDMADLYYIFGKYKELYESNLKNLGTNCDLYRKKLYKKLIILFKINQKVFQCLLYKNKNIEYKTDRLNKFMNKLNEIYNYNKTAKTIICVQNRKMVYLLYNYLNRDNPQNIFYKDKTRFIVGSNNKKDESSTLTLSTRITTSEINERKKEYNENKINILICTIPGLEYLTKEKCDHILVFSEFSTINNDLEKIKEKAISSNANLHIFLNESKSSSNKIINELLKENENNDCNNNILLKKYFLDRDKNIKNPNNFISKNYIQNKHIEQNYYYYIEKTEAKMSFKNCMLLFNEIYNSYISNNIKFDINKITFEVPGEQKYMCQTIFKWGNNKVQFPSEKYNDKQSAENDCFLKYVIYMHKNGYIDDNFRIKM